jgi:hypothetical protein
MTEIDWIGSVGVSFILIAYILNINGKLHHKNLLFILFNFIGASLACAASILMDYLPFIILEGVWAFVSLISLLKYKKQH